jgi:tetratricopeptide (TPR) repeat protein/lipoprotein signal peptidase
MSDGPASLSEQTVIPATEPPRPAWWKRALANTVVLLVLAFVAWVPYSNSLNAEFIFDSEAIIKYDPRLRDPKAAHISLLSPSQSGSIWTSHYWHCESAFYDLFYRPLITLSYAVNYWPFGYPEFPAKGTPQLAALQRSYHFVNWAIHLLNVFLVYALCRRLMSRHDASGRAEANTETQVGDAASGAKYLWAQLAAFFAAALFAVHPVQTESVTNIVGRADLLATLFVVAGFLAHMQARASGGLRSIGWIVLTVFALLAGLLTKENAIVLIALAFLYDISLAPKRSATEQQQQRAWLAKWAPVYGGFVVVTILFFVVRWLVLRKFDPSYVDGLNNPLVDHGFIASKLTALKVVGKQLFLLLWPIRLSPDYSYDAIPVFTLDFSQYKNAGAFWGLLLEDSKALAAAAALVALLVFAIKTWRRHSLLTFLALAFLVTLLPTSNLILEIGTIMADRFLYMPSIWFCLFVAIGGAHWAQRRAAAPKRRNEKVVLGIALVVLALAAAWPLGWPLAPTWLIPDLAGKVAGTRDAFGFGLFALWLPPFVVAVVASLLLLPRLSAMKTASTWALCAALAGVIQLEATRTYARNIDWQSTANLWKSAVTVCPQSAKTHVNFSNSVFHQYGSDIPDDLLEDAIRHSEIAWGMKHYATFGANLGAFYVLKADRLIENAVRRGLTGEPMNQALAQAQPLYQRAVEVLLGALPDEQRMVRILHEGLRKQGKPLDESKAHGNPAVYQNLGTALVRLNRFQEAAAALRHAIALEPYNVNGRIALAEALVRQGKLEEAAVALLEAIALDNRNVGAGRMLADIYAQLLPNQNIVGIDPPSQSVRIVASPAPDLVKNHLCAALVNLTRHFAAVAEKTHARAVREAGVTQYGCPPQPFDDALQNPVIPRIQPQP